LAETEPWVQPLSLVLDPALNLLSFAMVRKHICCSFLPFCTRHKHTHMWFAHTILSFSQLCRVVLSWYPSTNLNKTPWNIVAWPTEPLLRVLRGSIPPAFGVDITPIVWLGIFTFLHEILLGQQGLLIMKMKYGI
jgi:YggT family protein